MIETEVALPEYIQIEPVGQCNLRCQMCPIQFRKDGPPYGPPALMPLERFRAIIDEIAGLKELHLQGLGEPTIHPQFFDMVRYAVSRGVTVSTNTNMTLLTPERARQCVASGLDAVHVSIDGATAPTYERIRAGARFRRVLRNLKLLNAAKRDLQSQKPSIRMVNVAMRQNIHELPQLVRLAARLEIRSLFVQHLAHDFAESSLPSHYRPMRDFVQEQTLLCEDEERVIRIFSEARAAARECGVELRLPRVRPAQHAPGTPGRSRCDWPWRGMYFSYDGKSMPCCMIATPDRKNFGGVDQAKASDIWRGAEYEEFRRRLDSDDPPEICKTCSVYSRTF